MIIIFNYLLISFLYFEEFYSFDYLVLDFILNKI